ncbi:MAG: fused MFS/spermidine synthase [Caldilineales bacterium]|nr:fused MFS/spermidine synthase [Caldilineales bacterium]
MPTSALRPPTSAPRPLLYALVFTAGFVSLGVELAAGRLLDPWFGNSILVWASVIGLILLYLSVGYWLGGRVADRDPRALTLFTLAGFAAVAVGLIPLIARPILALAADVFVTYNAAILLGSFAATLLLFGPAVILLGMVSPFAIRLLVQGREDAGSASGGVFALSTVGSILGVFVTVLVLVPNLGTRRTFFTLALLLLTLVILGMLRLDRRRALFFTLAWALLLALTLLPPGLVRADAGTIAERESAYNYIQVVQNGPEVLLKLNEGAGVHSVYREGMGLADGIWDYFLLAPYFNPVPARPQDVDSLLMIGLAAGTVPKLFTAAYGPIPIDGVELDPDIIATGQRYFAMTEPNLRAVAQDGRYFLRGQAGTYDVIAIDAYRPPYIPFHLTTVEFFQEVRHHLNGSGVVAVNVARTEGDYTLVDALASTMAQVFPSVLIIDEPMAGFDLGNSLVVASMQAATLDDFLANTADLPEPLLAEVARRARPNARAAVATGPVLTDDLAPIEQIIHGIVLRYILR